MDKRDELLNILVNKSMHNRASQIADDFKVDFSDLRTVWNKIVSEYGPAIEDQSPPGFRFTKEKSKILPEDLFEWDEE